MEQNNNNYNETQKKGIEFVDKHTLLQVYVNLMNNVSFSPNPDDVEQWKGIFNELRQDLHLITNNVTKVDGEPGSSEWLEKLSTIIMSNILDDSFNEIEGKNSKHHYQYDLVISSYLPIIFRPEKFPSSLQEKVLSLDSLKAVIMLQHSAWRNSCVLMNDEIKNGLSAIYSTYANHLLATWIMVYGMPFKFDIDKINEEIDKPFDLEEFLRLSKAALDE